MIKALARALWLLLGWTELTLFTLILYLLSYLPDSWLGTLVSPTVSGLEPDLGTRARRRSAPASQKRPSAAREVYPDSQSPVRVRGCRHPLAVRCRQPGQRGGTAMVAARPHQRCGRDHLRQARIAGIPRRGGATNRTAPGGRPQHRTVPGGWHKWSALAAGLSLRRIRRLTADRHTNRTRLSALRGIARFPLGPPQSDTKYA